MGKFPDLIQSKAILTEGAVIERLRRDSRVQLDPWIEHAGFVNDPAALAVLEEIEREYIAIGCSADIPMIVFTPTWHASPDRLKKAGQSGKYINARCSRFLIDLVNSYGDYSEKILVGGLIGCRGDAYRPEEALGLAEARDYHRMQIDELSRSEVDFLCAATLPAISEAEGIAMAMAETDLPYAISFVIRGNGTMLDGTPLHEAVAAIRTTASRPPAFFMVNCVHPAVMRSAMMSEPEVAEHVIGLQANTSPRSPDELEGLEHLETEDPIALADAMMGLRDSFGLRVLGGCCGTDDRHIRALAERISAE